MEYYNSIDNLKILLKNILTTQVSNQEILDFVNFCQSQKEFNNIEQELLILKIYITLKKINNFIPLITYSLDAIPEKIILQNYYSEEKEKYNASVEKIETEKKDLSLEPSTVKRKSEFELNKENSKENLTKEKISISEVKKRIIDYYSPFLPEKNPNIQFPPPGEEYNLYISNITIIPGKVYTAEVLIDSNGNITNFLKDPIEQFSTDNYTEIYNGLVGQLFKFQEAE